MSNVDSRVDEILKEIIDPVTPLLARDFRNKIKKDLKLALQQVVSEMIPKKRVMVNPVPDSDEVIAWNACVEVMRARMEQVFGKKIVL